MNKDKNLYIIYNEQKHKTIIQNTFLCLSCRQYKIEKPKNGFVERCALCFSIYNFFNPNNFQRLIITDPNYYIYNIGGVGSGKTTVFAYMISNHLRRFPGTMVCAVAPNVKQFENSGLKELKKFFHSSEYEWSSSKRTFTVKDTGSTLYLAADKDPEAIRSLNISYGWVLEASGVNIEIVKELSNRTRNTLAVEYDLDENGNYKLETEDNKTTIKVLKSNFKILIESNPSKDSWVNENCLNTKYLYATSNVMRGEKFRELLVRMNPKYIPNTDIYEKTATYLSTPLDNPWAGKDVLNQYLFGKTQKEINELVYCDILASNERVYKNFLINKDKYALALADVDSYELFYDYPMFCESLDVGGSKKENDATAYILARCNPTTHKIFILDCYKQSGTLVVDDCLAINELRNEHMFDISKSLFLTGDSAGLNREMKSSHDTLANEYERRLRVRFNCQNVKGSIGRGVVTVNRFISLGYIHLLKHERTLKLLKELEGYYFDENDQAYVARNEDHLLDALRYLVVKFNQISPLDYDNDSKTYLTDFYKDFKNKEMMKTKLKNPHDPIKSIVEKIFETTLKKKKS